MKIRFFGGFLVVALVLFFLYLGGVWFELFWLLVFYQAFREGQSFFAPVTELPTTESPMAGSPTVDSPAVLVYRVSSVILLLLLLFFSLIPLLPLAENLAVTLYKLRSSSIFSLTCGIWLFLFLRVLLNRGHDILADFMPTLSALAVFTYISCFYLAVFQLSVLYGQQATGIILFLFLVMWLQDTLAYFGGMLLGRHKMSPVLSPKKTWEGAFCGTVGALLLLYPFADNWQTIFGHNFFLLFFLTSISGQFGDLVESLLKRGFAKKDSGHIIPGHGGVLDRFDSVTAAAVAVLLWRLST